MTTTSLVRKGPPRKRLKRYDFKAVSSPLSDEMDKNQTSENIPPLPDGPVFYATQQDFEKSPIDFINKIRPLAQKYGICKIVPPKNWNPPFGTFGCL